MRVCFQDPSHRISAVLEVNRRSVLVRKGGWFRNDEYEEVVDRQEVSVMLHPPEMVIIPGGSFLMGSPDAEAQYAEANETPQHLVTIQPFAISKTAVTFEQYDAFAEITARDKPKDEGWGRGNRPVINVYWADAHWYCKWLTEQTGQTYRLPTEAEWEYACRAGTTTLFSFGDPIKDNQANYDDSRATWSNGLKEGAFLGKTQPVGSYPANPWGLYDMHGNVLEYTEDHYHENYVGAPADGSAPPRSVSDGFVVRGGSWADCPWNLYSARRKSYYQRPDKTVGFRVVRELTP
jgi:formylglycine-generating enzyme required for sulfatase activity